MNLFLTGASSAELARTLHSEWHFATIAHTPRTWRCTLADEDALEAVGRSELAARAMAAHVDWAMLRQDQTWTAFRTLATDMDSTLITIECIDELADVYAKKAEVAAITEAAMRGEITDFAESLRRRVSLLRGLPESALHAVYRERLQLSAGAEQLIDAAHAHHLSTLLVSGGFTFFTDRLRDRLRLTEARSNLLECAEGLLTGQVIPPILDSAGKRTALAQHCAARGWTPQQAIAIGDGANDLPMLKSAGLSVAFHAKPMVAEAADIAIRHGGLDVLDDWLSPATAA